MNITTFHQEWMHHHPTHLLLHYRRQTKPNFLEGGQVGIFGCQPVRLIFNYSASSIVRIWTSIIREPGAWVQASKTAPATSCGSSIPEAATPCSVRPLPRANSVLTPPGQITPHRSP